MERWPAAASSPADAFSISTEAAVARFRLALDRHGTPPPTPQARTNPAVVIVRGLLEQLGDHVAADDIVGCVHLANDGRPVYWLASLPDAYLCGPCLTTAPTPMGCDSCSTRSRALTRWAYSVASRTTIVSFLCPACTGVLDRGAR